MSIGTDPTNTLIDALVSAGVAKCYAEAIAQEPTFATAQADKWLSGLMTAAVLFTGGKAPIPDMPSPWDTICPRLANLNGTGPDEALLECLKTYDSDVQVAIIAAVGSVAASLSDQMHQTHATSTQSTLSPSQVAGAQQAAQYLQPVDPALVRQVQAALHQKGLPKDQRRKRAGEILIEWLANHGRFIMAPVSGSKYYLFRDEHKLFNLESDIWHAWLYRATGCNPAGIDFKYLAEDCRAAAYDGDRVEVCRVAHWDGEFLRVSRFDGIVYRLDGQTIETELNGDGPIVFDDNPAWTPYSPDLNSDSSALEWWLNTMNPASFKTENKLALKAWLLSLFFTELCPTQVLLVLRGETGSGKSMILRLLMRLLFGPAGQISGVPDKPDGFTASAANTHVLVLDNLDEPADWLRDKLARITTGGIDHYRRLYTGNDLGTIHYRCWVAITTRTPDTLRRDDLADRVLMIELSRINEEDRIRESSFLVESLTRRSQWWGDVLLALNRTVATIRRDGIPKESTMRMADFEALGRTIARADGQEDIWVRVVRNWSAYQCHLLLEDSVITEALERWLATPTNRKRQVDTRTLFQECELALFGTNRPDRSWPRSARSFGKALAAIRRSLQSRLDVRWWESPSRTYYEFDLLQPVP